MIDKSNDKGAYLVRHITYIILFQHSKRSQTNQRAAALAGNHKGN